MARNKKKTDGDNKMKITKKIKNRPVTKKKKKRRSSNSNKRRFRQEECIHCTNANLTEKNIKKHDIQFDNLPSTSTVVNTPKIIICTRCGSKACHDCLSKFIAVVPSQSLRLSLIKSNKWFRDINTYISTDQIPEDFVGGCCTVSIDKLIEVPPNSENSIVDISATNHGYEGYLHVYQYNLLIKPTFDRNSLSVLSIAGDKKLGTEGAMHAVVDQNLAARNRQIKFHPSPDPDGAHHKNCTELKHVFKIPDHFGDGKDGVKEIRASIKIFDRISDHNPEKMKCFIKEEDIVNARINEEDITTKCDVRILLGKTNITQKLHLISCRFSHIESIKLMNKGAKNDETQNKCNKAFFKDGLKRCGKGGKERIRCNVGGPIEFNKTFMEYLKDDESDSKFPRKAEAVSFVKHPNNGQLLSFYINPDNTKAVFWDKYTQPVYGGQFTVNEEMFNKYDVLHELTKHNYITALIMDEFNTNYGNEHGQVQENAVKQTLKVLKVTLDKLDYDQSNNKHGDTRIKALLRSLSVHDANSLVAYPCAYHMDQYQGKDNSAGFESITHMSIRRLEDEYGDGRGGYICSSSSRRRNRTNSYYTVGWILCPKKKNK